MLTPPTDNVYKFIAISGVVLILAGVFLIRDASEERISTAQNLFIDRTLYEISSGLLNEYYSDRIRWIELADSLGLRDSSGAVASFPYQSVINESEMARRSQESALKVDRDEALMHTVLIATRYEFAAGTLLILIGLLGSFIGFRMWYFRFQRYQDTIARVNAIESQRRL